MQIHTERTQQTQQNKTLTKYTQNLKFEIHEEIKNIKDLHHRTGAGEMN